ncbi:hypothetical protein BOTBODRAFT_188716 [Botryobasidium botryosum FD-172 SS1]|uniref:Uncharacterized protein n=1 Tax=Botryobasidium botryosum (strain FD-172 SS1) TaxID=930990 RepID=A0A067MMT1_BOTB1|nr:hypothetical protein BOTBODRAFT_188716 [Botryobasidium botryosum FD-172 SS1]
MASSTRPPLARGHTTPIYERRNPATDPPGLRLPSLPEVPDHAYHPRPPGSSSSETTRRVLSADDVIHTTTSRRPSPRLPLPLPTPHPHAHAFPNGIFSPGYDHSSANSSHAPPRAAGSYFPSPMAPSISTPVPATNTNVPHCRVSNTVPYPQHSAVKMEIETSRTEHVLYAPIGPGFSSDFFCAIPYSLSRSHPDPALFCPACPSTLPSASPFDSPGLSRLSRPSNLGGPYAPIDHLIKLSPYPLPPSAIPIRQQMRTRIAAISQIASRSQPKRETSCS